MARFNFISSHFFYLLFFAAFSFHSFHGKAQLLDSLVLTTLPVFTSLEEALKTPDDVLKLDLRKNKFKEFPKEIYQFKYLQILNLSKNKLVEVPKEIARLKYLQDLDLSRNRLESLPAEIGQLIHLSYFRLGQNELFALPAEIGKLEKLKFLDLWSNNLSTLPIEIGNLKKLKEMDMRVIQLNEAKQNDIKKLLPNTLIHFSKSCSCD